MPDLVDRLASEVTSRMRKLGFHEPTRKVIGTLLELAYLGTLRSEEGRFVKGSLTFENPNAPADFPYLRRADYPTFTRLGSAAVLNVQSLVKLARAVDRWSGSIAVYATRRDEIVVWGVVDQLVQQNVRWHREAGTGFENPGLLTITMDGIGDISAYHGDLFLGGLKAQTLITRESDALKSPMIVEYGFRALMPFATAIARVLDNVDGQSEILERLFSMWVNSLARLCIGLRQRGTGGAFLLTPKPITSMLKVAYPFAYRRLGDANILRVLEEFYSVDIQDAVDMFSRDEDSVPTDLILEASLAEADANDRTEEITGSVKLVSSLAAVDGLVLMTPTLSVSGFGVKIGSAPEVKIVYDGASFARLKTRARKIDLSQFGTRHRSMVRYCSKDRNAVGLVVSQDGYVRMIMTIQNSLVLWDNIKLLDHRDFSPKVAIRDKERRKSRKQNKRPVRLGYTDTPKTIAQLLKAASRKRTTAIANGGT
jgi:hypothetical protein